MKGQIHNDGKLKELTVKIDEDVVIAVEKMAKKSGLSIDELVVIALKRFRSHHADYENMTPIIDES